MAKKYYAIKAGRQPGIYTTWDEAKAQVHGFAGAQYKGFMTKEEAEAYMEHQVNLPSKDDEATVEIYVDGSYDHTTKRYSYGMVVLNDDGNQYYAKAIANEAYAVHRNVAGEIEGAKRAMAYGKDHGYQKIVIYFDYQGIEKWCTGEWKTNVECTKEYKAYFDQMSKDISIYFVKVKGHSGEHYNDVADCLAKTALGLEEGAYLPLQQDEWSQII